MERKRTRTTVATWNNEERPGRAARIGVGLLLAAMALMLGVVTARAQDDGIASGLNEAVASGWDGYEEQPLRVNVWHDRDDDDVYRRGESVRIHFEANHDAYAVVYRVDAEGQVSVLWPRSRYDDGFIFGHHAYNVPAAGAARIRAADVDGVEYVQALVSAYPFDLRGLDIDFHHEREDEVHGYYVAGDPFLAMNDVNFAITGLEDAEDFVVSNYASWYVGRRVEHPRYLCGQCHDTDPDPYATECVVEIHHDYGWGNSWYASYGYYPIYSYPVYYYVDPWTWRPWVNYWYRPWYSWPRYGFSWGFDCYAWNYSPYWSGDVWVRYKDGNRRYRPLGKGERYKSVAGDADYRHPSALGKSPRPTQNMLAALDDRGPVGKRDRDVRAVKDREAFRDVPRTKREPQSFTRDRGKTPEPGLRTSPTRYPATIGGGATSRGDAGQVRVRPDSRDGGARTITKGERAVRPTPRDRGDERNLVRPVEPRSKGSRIWQGGRNGTATPRPEREVKPAPRNDNSRGSTRTVQPRSRPESSGGGSQTIKPKSEGSSRKAPTVQPRSGSSGKSGSSANKSDGSSRSGSSSKSSGGGKSKGSSAKQR